MNASVQTWEKSGTMDACQVVVLYDGLEARNKVLRICNHLVMQFEDYLAFDFNWWRMDFLKEEESAKLCASQAGVADILIICASPAGPLAAHVREWFGIWVQNHSQQVGILVDMTKADAKSWDAVRATKQFLREAAVKAGFDYLESSYVPVESLIKPFELGQDNATNRLSHPEYFPDEQPPAPEHCGLGE